MRTKAVIDRQPRRVYTAPRVLVEVLSAMVI